MKHLVVLTLVFIACLGCGKSDPDTLVRSGYDQDEMETAIARAKSEVESFIQELSSPTGSNHAVKAPISDDGETEHFWLTEVAYSNAEFKGVINNEPGIVGNVMIGQNWTVKKTEISDWTYIKNDKMYGNYTMRPLLKTLPDDEAELYRSMLADPE